MKTARQLTRIEKARKALEPYLREAEENRLFGTLPVGQNYDKLRNVLIEAINAGVDPKTLPLSLMQRAGLED